MEHLIELDLCEKRKQVRAYGLEFLQEYCGAGRSEGFGGSIRLHSIKIWRCAEEDGPLNKHVKTLTTFMVSMSIGLPDAPVVENAFMKLLQESEVGGRSVEELSAFARVGAVVYSSRYPTVDLRISSRRISVHR